MKEELQSFEKAGAWEEVDCPTEPPVTLVKSKWVFKRKVTCESEVRFRARLVARGFTQKQGIDYFETFSPVIRHSSLRVLFAIAVKLGLNIFHLDVKTAFLNECLEERVYMEIPEGCSSSGRNKCFRLIKAIYGLKQSFRVWNEQVNKVLLDIDYCQSKYEPCIYIKGKENKVTIIALYVDDFFIYSNDLDETVYVKSHLGSVFQIKDLGAIRECLGMKVNYDKD